MFYFYSIVIFTLTSILFYKLITRVFDEDGGMIFSWISIVVVAFVLMFNVTTTKEKPVVMKVTSRIIVDCHTGNDNGSVSSDSKLNMYTDLKNPNRLVTLERDHTVIIRSSRNEIEVTGSHPVYRDFVKDLMENDSFFSVEAMSWPFSTPAEYERDGYSWYWNRIGTDQTLYTDKLKMF